MLHLSRNCTDKNIGIDRYLPEPPESNPILTLAKTEFEKMEKVSNNVGNKDEKKSNDPKDIIRGLIRYHKAENISTETSISKDNDKHHNSTSQRASEDLAAKHVVSVEIKQDTVQPVVSAPVKKIVYTSNLSCFEWTLVILNILIFVGIIVTASALLRLLAFTHQRDITIYLSQFIPAV